MVDAKSQQDHFFNCLGEQVAREKKNPCVRRLAPNRSIVLLPFFLLPLPITPNPAPDKGPIVAEPELGPIVCQFVVAPETPPGQLVVARPGRAGPAAE